MPTADDADLDDLLGAEKAPLKKSTNGIHTTTTHSSPGLCAFLSAYLSYLCFAYPKCCGMLSCLASFVIVTMLVASVVNPTQSFGVVPHDWTTVNSIYELDVAKIDHWCLGGGNDGCRCEDPLVPSSRAELRSWTEAYKDNRRMIDQYMADELFLADLDVAIVGESAVEEMDGRWLGRFRDDELRSIGTIFKNHFNRDKGADVEGVALGIAGDSAGNVLWRLMHGEMPDGFEPKIWWVHLGANDLTRQQCSEEVVVLGILRVVEEILNKRPNARIVINSLLPMADLRGGAVVTEKDYRDAFSTYRGKRTIHYVRKTDGGAEQFVKKKGSSTSKSNSSDKHTRRLLEAALESYHSKTNDNTEEIEQLQRQLQDEILNLEDPERSTEILIDNHNSHRPIQRRLDDDIPKEMRHDKYNPTINTEQHEQKKYSFFKEQRKPLWTSIYAINRQLWKFCEKHERVDFFDATNIFAKRQGDIGQKYFTLLSDKISARGHPTQIGYLEWEDAMVVMIKKILEEMKREQPELFLTPAEPSNYQGSIPAEVERVETKPYGEDRDGDMTTGGGGTEKTDDAWGDEDTDDQTTGTGEGQQLEGADTQQANDDGSRNDNNEGNDEESLGQQQEDTPSSYSQPPPEGIGEEATETHMEGVQSYGEPQGGSTSSQQPPTENDDTDDAAAGDDDSTQGTSNVPESQQDVGADEDDQVGGDADGLTTPGDGTEQGGVDYQAGGGGSDDGIDQTSETDDTAAPGGDTDQDGTDDRVGGEDTDDDTAFDATETGDAALGNVEGGTDDQVGGDTDENAAAVDETGDIGLGNDAEGATDDQVGGDTNDDADGGTGDEVGGDTDENEVAVDGKGNVGLGNDEEEGDLGDQAPEEDGAVDSTFTGDATQGNDEEGGVDDQADVGTDYGVGQTIEAANDDRNDTDDQADAGNDDGVEQAADDTGDAAATDDGDQGGTNDGQTGGAREYGHEKEEEEADSDDEVD